MKKPIKIFLTLFLLFAILSPVVVNATLMSYGYPTPTFSVKNYSYNSVWQPPMDASINTWNSTATKVWISKNSTSENTITAAQYADTWYGQATQYKNIFGKVTSFSIKLNSKTIATDATNINKFIQSVFTHEIGHILWLADNPSTTSSSIMKYSRDRNSMTGPQTYDINDVNIKFP